MDSGSSSRRSSRCSTIEITALITGLGVSGIAVALAVQNILGDMLAALAIVFDKPFDVGDTIGVDKSPGRSNTSDSRPPGCAA